MVDLYTVIASISFAVQVGVLFVLISGYYYKQRNKFRQHGILMLSAVVLHAVTIFIIMIPSFVLALIPEFILKNPSETISILAALHGPLGLVAFLFGLWLVVSWRLRKDVSMCFGRKNIMRITITVWIVALILGILIFSYFYIPGFG